MPDPVPKGSAGAPLDLLVAGHLNLDAEVRVPHLPGNDRTVPVLGRRESLGGTAANISRWASHLGVRTALAAFVGPDLPPRFLQRLKRDGVETADVVVRKGEFTPVCWIFEDGKGGQTTVIDQGAMRSTKTEGLPVRSLRRARLVHITTGDPVFQLRLARTARRAGKIVAFDPAQEVHYRWDRKGLEELLGLSEIFFGNEQEYVRARHLIRAGSPEEFLAHVPLAVVTRGKRGARAYTRSGTIDVPAAPIRQFHRVTGAGDSFRGGFYRAWFAGEPLPTCLTWGSATAASLVEHPPGVEGDLPPTATIERKFPARPRVSKGR